MWDGDGQTGEKYHFSGLTMMVEGVLVECGGRGRVRGEVSRR